MRPRSTLLATLALLVALAGCEHPSRPWEQPDAGAQVTEVPPPVVAQVAVTDAGAVTVEAGVVDPDAPASPVRVGGPWVRCYGGFHPSNDPKKDVTRLSLLCGPENGMRRLSKRGGHDAAPAALEGAVAEGGATLRDTFEAKRGECFRVFAVAEPSVVDLDVAVRSSRGALIAADHGDDRWPIVQPDRPFCALEDDTYTWEVSAKRGAGRAAGEVWVLRAP